MSILSRSSDLKRRLMWPAPDCIDICFSLSSGWFFCSNVYSLDLPPLLKSNSFELEFFSLIFLLMLYAASGKSSPLSILAFYIFLLNFLYFLLYFLEIYSGKFLSLPPQIINGPQQFLLAWLIIELSLEFLIDLLLLPECY